MSWYTSNLQEREIQVSQFIVQWNGEIDEYDAQHIRTEWMKSWLISSVYVIRLYHWDLKVRYIEWLSNQLCWTRWSVSQSITQKIMIVNMRMLRWLCWHIRRDNIKNEDKQYIYSESFSHLGYPYYFIFYFFNIFIQTFNSSYFFSNCYEKYFCVVMCLLETSSLLYKDGDKGCIYLFSLNSTYSLIKTSFRERALHIYLLYLLQDFYIIKKSEFYNKKYAYISGYLV